MERRILVERKVRARPVLVGRVIRQQMTEVPFPQHHDMVEALTSDRADQPFDMPVLPRCPKPVAAVSVGGRSPLVVAPPERAVRRQTPDLPARARRIAPSAVVTVVTMFPVAVVDRDDRVIVAVLEVFGGRRLIVVVVGVSGTREAAGFCGITYAPVSRQGRIGANGA